MAVSLAEHHALRLAHAEAHAALHGLALTPLRRQVYAAILDSERAIGAYELLDALEPQRGRVPGHVKAREQISMVQRGRSQAGRGGLRVNTNTR